MIKPEHYSLQLDVDGRVLVVEHRGNIKSTLGGVHKYKNPTPLEQAEAAIEQFIYLFGLNTPLVIPYLLWGIRAVA